MRFLVDEDLPRSLAVALRSAGHEALDVRDIGLRGHSDQDVFRAAQQRGAVLVSGDRGFANILSHPPGSHAGILIAHFPKNEIPPPLDFSGVRAQLARLFISDRVTRPALGAEWGKFTSAG